eukprot:gb/GECH01011281.1/.p1 GENE.gb/GECH01011281.1/~~gb/GECH01011281.1/.p1  ORF type:complete len:231 (+),score=50.22 gb/GECH01011281.1/:1-693(+)
MKLALKLLLGFSILTAIAFTLSWAEPSSVTTSQDCPFPLSAEETIKEEARIIIDILEKYKNKDERCQTHCNDEEHVCVSRSGSGSSSESFGFQDDDRSSSSPKGSSTTSGNSEDSTGGVVKGNGESNSMGTIIGVASAVGGVFALLAVLAFTLLAIYVYLKNRRKNSYSVFSLNRSNKRTMKSAVNEFLGYHGEESDSDDEGEDEGTYYESSVVTDDDDEVTNVSDRYNM